MKIRYILVLTLFLFGSYTLKAQYTQTMYFMNGVPQSNMLNPAIQPESSFFLGLPVLSSFETGVGNNRFSLSDVVMPHPTEDSLITVLHPLANREPFLNSLKESNYLYQDVSTNLFSLGFRTGSMYWSLNVAERVGSRMGFPKDLFVLGLEGNDDFMNSVIDFSGLNFDAMYFREYSLAVSKQLGTNITVGVRPKVLFGKANINVDNKSLGIYNSIDSLRISADMDVNISGPVHATYNSDGDFDGLEENEDLDYIDYVLSHENFGLGIDIGVTYKPIDKLALYLSVIDLGYIKWDKDVTNLTLNGNYTFTGIDLTSELDSDVEGDPMEELLDSVENSFSISDDTKAYTTYLSSKLYIGASWYITDNLDVSFLSRTVFINDGINQMFSVSANARPARAVNVSLSYSYMNNTFNNIGLGLAFKPGPLQFYVISDNVSAALWGHKTTSLNFRFGLNVVIGSKKRRLSKDLPMLESTF